MIINSIVFAILSALYDKGKRFEDHSSRFITRAFIILVITLFASGNIIINFFLGASVFFLFFDYTLNILERRPWYYLGNTAKLDILRNKIFGKWVKVIDPLLKTTLVIILTIIKYTIWILS